MILRVMADEEVLDIPVPSPLEIELLKLLKSNEQDDAFVICNGSTMA